MRFVCADGEPQYRALLDEQLLEKLRAAGHELAWFDGRPPDADAWVERLHGCDGVLLLWPMPAGVLVLVPSVRVVSFAGTGIEAYVDVEEARRLGIALCNVPGYGANAVAEHAFALALAVARSVAAGDRTVRSGRWGPGEGKYAGVELRGRRLGVVGAGPIGSRAVAIGRGLGMHVVAWTRSPSPERASELGAPFVALAELFRTADVVTLHLAHRPETERVVDARLLGLLGPDAIFVNTARAQLVDTDALVAVLERGAILGAGLDVFEAEPLPRDHPLLRLDNVVLTPHIGFNTPQASAELMRIALENIVAFAAGRPQNLV